MRQQYHARDTPAGRLIWDVFRLIELSRDLPRREVPLSEIVELDEPFWFAGDADLPTCRAVADHARLIQSTDLAYPIILSADGRVMDGMHRVCKAYLDGRRAITAVRFDATPPPDYVDVPLDALPYEDREMGRPD